MSDLDLRVRQRTWEANPSDQVALTAYLAARRQAGLAVPQPLLDERVFPARTLLLPAGVECEVMLPDQTFGTFRGGEVGIPPHTGYTIFVRDSEQLRRVADQQPHGLEVLCDAEVTDLPPVKELTLWGLESDQLNCFLATQPELEYLEFHCGVQSPLDVEFGECPRLTRVEIHSAWLGPRTVPGLSGLPSLSSLRLRESSPLDGFHELQRLEHLTHLELDECDIDEEHIEAVGGLHDLESLVISSSAVAGNLEHLRALSSLTQLVVGGRGGVVAFGLGLRGSLTVTHGDLKHLTHLPLRTLVLDRLLEDEDVGVLPASLTAADMSLSPSGIAKLSRLTQLRSVSFVGALDADCARGLPLGAPNLEQLSVMSTSFGDDAVAHVAELPLLVDLDLSHTKVTDAGLAALHERSLERLSLLTEHVTDAGVRALLENQLSLRDLELVDSGSGVSGLTGACLDSVAQLGRLERLRLRLNEPIGDGRARALRDMTRLRSLDLGSCRTMTEKGLQLICTLTELRELVLDDVSWLDDTHLDLLATLTRLEALSLKGSSVSEAGEERLKRKLLRHHKLEIGR